MVAKKKETTVPVVTCFEIAAELQTVTQKIIDQDGELKDGDFEALQQWQAALEDKAENIAFVKERLEKEADYFKAIEDKAKSMRRARESALERLRKYLAECMTKAGVQKVKKENGLFTISLTPGRVVPRIDDQNKLPLEFVEIFEVMKNRTDAIKAALEAGKEVPGAHLESGEPFITIR
jgi:hypothetical protein